MIQRLGFFHFPANDGNPIEQLTDCVKQDASLGQGESLIVLPEGFNLLCNYYEPNCEGRLAEAADYRRCLEDLARRYSITFVVGLIEPRDSESSRRNVAYVVTPSGHSLLCCKMNADGSSHYQPCGCAEIPESSFIVGNLALRCLICMDAIQQTRSLGSLAPGAKAANRRRIDVLSELRTWAETPGQNALLCVPAAFSDNRNWNNMEELRGMAVIVANADVRSPSVIVSQSCAQVAIRDGSHNHLHLTDIDHVFPAALN